MRDLPFAIIPIIFIPVTAGGVIYSFWAGFDDNTGLALSSMLALAACLAFAWRMRTNPEEFEPSKDG